MIALKGQCQNLRGGGRSCLQFTTVAFRRVASHRPANNVFDGAMIEVEMAYSRALESYVDTSASAFAGSLPEERAVTAPNTTAHHFHTFEADYRSRFSWRR